MSKDSNSSLVVMREFLIGFNELQNSLEGEGRMAPHCVMSAMSMSL